MEKVDILEQVRNAQRVSVPFIAIETTDPTSLVERFREGYNPKLGADESPIDAKGQVKGVPLIAWDIIRGFQHINEQGYHTLSGMGITAYNPNATEEDGGPAATGGAKTAPKAVMDLTRFVSVGNNPGPVVFMYNAHKSLEDPQTNNLFINALTVARPDYERENVVLVMMGPGFSLPPEMKLDIVVMSEPLPDPEQIKQIVKETLTFAKVDPDNELIKKSAEAVKGLNPFSIRQAVMLSSTSVGKKVVCSIPALWDRKRQMIDQVQGLSMVVPRFTRKHVGGAAAWWEFVDDIMKGPKPWSSIVWLDECEKMLAGATGGPGMGDSTGTSQDALGTALTEMELHSLFGASFVGPAGTGKSLLAEAMAGTYDIPLIRLDFGGTKDMYLGNSEKNIRAAFKTLIAIGGESTLILATFNWIDAMPAALRRRLGVFGVWFVDLPDADEREDIAQIQCKAFHIDPVAAVPFFKQAEGWSGANIRDCCRGAEMRQCTVERNSLFIVPAAKQEGDSLDVLREKASNRFLRLSTPGIYTMPTPKVPATPPRTRKVIG